MRPLADEDTLVSDSDSKAPTQQSVKAYVDSQVAGRQGRVISGFTSTVAAITDKVVVADADPQVGDILVVVYVDGQLAASPRLIVNEAEAVPVYAGGTAPTADTAWAAVADRLFYYFDEGAYHQIGVQRDTNTEYQEISTAEIDDSTAVSPRTITGRRIAYLRNEILSQIFIPISTGLTTFGNGIDGRLPAGSAAVGVDSGFYLVGLGGPWSAVDVYVAFMPNGSSTLSGTMVLSTWFAAFTNGQPSQHGNISDKLQVVIEPGIVRPYREVLVKSQLAVIANSMSAGTIVRYGTDVADTYAAAVGIVGVVLRPHVG